MQIEPCFYCGEDEVTVSSYPNGEQWQYWTVCGACEAQGPLCDSEEKAITAHNRLSRIVRAAEAWARLLPHGPSGEYVKAVDALFEAVEGGAE